MLAFRLGAGARPGPPQAGKGERWTLLAQRKPGTLGGEGRPQRSMASSRSPAPLRTTGAIWSGKMPGSGGKLPVRSTAARNASRIAASPALTL